jgi:6-phosphofructokinase 1
MSLDRLHSTAASHHRVMVCELMGRNAGWLTLHAGIGSGSDVILIPEIPFDIDTICRFVKSRTRRGRGFSIVACAEGAHPRDGEPVVAQRIEDSPDPIRLGGIGEQVARAVAERSGIETRTTVLGHVQRGGPPVPADRVLATRFGFHALELLMEGARNRLVVMRDGRITDCDVRDAMGRQRRVPLDDPLIDVGRAVRTCFGD